MLKFNAVVCIMSTKFTSRLCWRFTALFTSNPMIVASQFSTVAFKQNRAMPLTEQKEIHQKNFETLRAKVQKSLQPNTSILSQIQNAKNIDEMLKFISAPTLTKDEISTVMDAIISWVNESNAIYKKNETENVDNKSGRKNENPTLNRLKTTTVDPALKYKDLSTSVMIQEVHKLAKQKKRQSTDLNYLLENIWKYNEKLSISQCSTLLYSMATLRYFDKKLCDLISETLIKDITIESCNALKSILQSMAMLRYKNVNFLKHSCKLITNSKDLHVKHVTSILRSLAVLGFISNETDEVIEKYLSSITIDLLGVDNWLYYVWCLVLLNNFQKQHIESVLNGKFIRALYTAAAQFDILQQTKLLNINAAAKFLVTDYHGPLLEEDIIPNGVVAYSKEKEQYVKKLKSALQFMTKSETCFQTSVNTGMGFLLDAECYLNSELTFVSPNTSVNKKIHKLAIIVYDYDAYCLDSDDVTGIFKFREKLLSHSGYKVIPIAYKHFGLEDNLLKVTSLLKSRIKVS